MNVPVPACVPGHVHDKPNPLIYLFSFCLLYMLYNVSIRHSCDTLQEEKIMCITQAILIISPIFFLPTAFIMLATHCFNIKSKMLKVKK